MRTGLRRMAIAWCAAAIVLWCAAVAAVEVSGPIVNLRGPLFSTPALVKPGDAVLIRVTPGARVETASLIDEYGSATRLMLDLAPDGYRATPSPPLKPGLYGLRAVTFGADGKAAEEFQPNSVAVFSEFKKDFDFVVISDLHFGAAGEKRITLEMKDIYRQRRAVFDKLLEIDFEFIIIPGDLNLYPETYHVSYPEGYEFLTKLLDRPAFIIPGNHDLYNKTVGGALGHVYGTEYWKKYYGPEYHSFRYGSLKFVGFNSCDWPAEWYTWDSDQVIASGTLAGGGVQREQYEWLESELGDVKGASEVVVYTHVPISSYVAGGKNGFPPTKLPGAPKKALVGLLQKAGVRHVFVGHLHYTADKPVAEGVTEHLIRNVGGNYLELPTTGFAVVHVRGGRISSFDVIELEVP